MGHFRLATLGSSVNFLYYLFDNFFSFSVIHIDWLLDLVILSFNFLFLLYFLRDLLEFTYQTYFLISAIILPKVFSYFNSFFFRDSVILL